MMNQHEHNIQQEKIPSRRNILISLVLNFVITLAEFIGGILSNSLALMSDALHNLSDTFSIFISYVAMIIGKKGSTRKNTFGYKRIEILADLCNNYSVEKADEIRRELENQLKGSFNIHHVTIQMEYHACQDKRPIV